MPGEGESECGKSYYKASSFKPYNWLMRAAKGRKEGRHFFIQKLTPYSLLHFSSSVEFYFTSAFNDHIIVCSMSS